MPELTGEVPGVSLVVSGGVAVVGIVAFCAAVTMAARYFSPTTVWLASGIAVGGVVFLAFAQLYLQPLVVQELRLGHAAFFLATLLGLPSAAAVWVALRRAARPTRGSVLFDSVFVTGSFLVALPVAALVASVPDMLAF